MNNALIPMVIERSASGERAMDIYSRLLQDRIIMLNEGVSDHTVSPLIAQLLYLESVDSTTPITMMINSPGGSVYSGLALADTMRYIKCPVHTIVNGMAASMGAFLLSCGTKGHRAALPNSTVMVHQVMSGIPGGTQATDIGIQYRQTDRLKTLLTKTLAENCGMSYDDMYAACERDYYMSAEEALKFGIIDKIITKKE